MFRKMQFSSQAKVQQVRSIFQLWSNHFINKCTISYPNFSETPGIAQLQRPLWSHLSFPSVYESRSFSGPVLLRLGKYGFFIIIENQLRVWSLFSGKIEFGRERGKELNLFKEDKGLWMCFSVCPPITLSMMESS